MDLLEAIYSQRAMRRLRPDPVPDELIWRILDAATRAPNGANLQPWRFMVLKDPEVKKKIQELYLDGMAHVSRPSEPRRPPRIMAKPGTPEYVQQTKFPGMWLAHHLAEVPVLIIGTVRLVDVASTTTPGACIFPALQNLMLAARSFGLGTVLTTVHRHREADVKKVLGIPDDVVTRALIPVGWPYGRFGPNVRRPPEEVAYWDGWGNIRRREAHMPGDDIAQSQTAKAD